MRFGLTVQGAVSSNAGGGAPAGGPSFSTNFAGPDASPIGDPWAVAFGFGNAVARVSNTARSSLARSAAYVANVALDVAGQYAQATLGTLTDIDSLSGVIAWVNEGDQSLAAFGAATDAVYLLVYDNGPISQLDSFAIACAPGDVMRLEVDAVGFCRGFVNGVQRVSGSASGAGLAAGNRAGVVVKFQGAGADSLTYFECGDL